MRFTTIAFLLGIATTVNAAEDTIYLEETVISGNQELPKVLYILPWRDMEAELLPQRALDFTQQSVLVPVYPEEQLRELGFRQTLEQARQKLANEQSTTPNKSQK